MLHVVFRLACAPHSFLSTELPNEGEQDAPFDAADVPSTLEALDASNQRVVEAAIYNHSNRQQQDHITLFHADHIKFLGFDVPHSGPRVTQEVQCNSSPSIVASMLRTIIDLRLHDVKALHNHILDKWDNWMEYASTAWKADCFLLYNTPITIALMYGQNSQVLYPDMADVEPRNWKRDCNYAHIKLFRFSITMHIKSVHSSTF